jgi:hypothetical protein
VWISQMWRRGRGIQRRLWRIWQKYSLSMLFKHDWRLRSVNFLNCSGNNTGYIWSDLAIVLSVLSVWQAFNFRNFFIAEDVLQRKIRTDGAKSVLQTNLLFANVVLTNWSRCDVIPEQSEKPSIWNECLNQFQKSWSTHKKGIRDPQAEKWNKSWNDLAECDLSEKWNKNWEV